jgi:hypothetical protein
MSKLKYFTVGAMMALSMLTFPRASACDDEKGDPIETKLVPRQPSLQLQQDRLAHNVMMKRDCLKRGLSAELKLHSPLSFLSRQIYPQPPQPPQRSVLGEAINRVSSFFAGKTYPQPPQSESWKSPIVVVATDEDVRILNSRPDRLRESPGLTLCLSHAGGFQSLLSLTNLEELYFDDLLTSQYGEAEDLRRLISDGLAELGVLVNLKVLHAQYLKVTDEALSQLRNLGNLQYLALSNVYELTNVGLHHLSNLPALKVLELGDDCPQVTAEGRSFLNEQGIKIIEKKDSDN